MSTETPSDLIELANRLADAGGDVIRPYFRQPIAIDTKADASPVTIADREAEQAIRAVLAVARPDDGIIGEEFGSEKTGAEYVWVIDPIDGTRSFITGRPIFGTLIALVHNGAPILGVIDQPIGGERWVGLRGHGATLNGNPIRVRECPTLADATIGTTAPDLFDLTGAKSWQQAAAAARHVVYGGDCYTYAQIATGLVDAVVEDIRFRGAGASGRGSRRRCHGLAGEPADTGFRRHYRRLRRCAPSRGIAGSAALTFL